MTDLSLRNVVDLITGDAHPVQFVPDLKVRRMSRVGGERLLTFELCIENDIAGVVDPAEVDADFQKGHARYQPAQTLKSGFYNSDCGLFFLLRRPQDIPHDDVFDPLFTARIQAAFDNHSPLSSLSRRSPEEDRRGTDEIAFALERIKASCRKTPSQ